MANLLQSTKTEATQAPGFYTDYLSGLASKGQEAQQAAQFVGAQPLQTKAFETACKTTGAQAPAFQTGQGYVGQAAGQNITGAATPYLQAATTASPLCAARPLICQSANLDISGLAGQYMSPYIQKAVQTMSDIGQRNIRQNLSPAATAAAVGSGQFGSQRGAQVLGQIQAQAEQDLNAQIAQMLNTGYGQALCAAKAKQGTLSTLAQQTAAAQQAQNAANLQAAQTAGGLTAQQAAALQQAGLGMGTLGQQAAATNLACVNALATLGGQQQTIAQNQQMFPLTSLSSLASLLQGYNIPTTVATQMQMSPLSTLAALGTGAAGFTAPKYDISGKAIPGSSPFDILKKTFGFGGSEAPTVDTTQVIPNTATPDDPAYGWQYFTDGTAIDPSGNYYKGGELIYAPTPVDYESNYDTSPNTDSGLSNDDIDRLINGCAAGGRVQSRAMGGAIGCMSSMDGGAVPSGFCTPACGTCMSAPQVGGLAGVKSLGQSLGCVSTQYRGALPFKG